MATKAERTTAYIIETVAPIFNRLGYVGTSMSDLTEATGLTKGALYGNFENKDALALAAFDYNSKKLLSEIDAQLARGNTALERIGALTQFYRRYHEFTEDLGGCPIINVGIDANHIHAQLLTAAQETIKIMEGKIAQVLENGSKAQEIKFSVAPLQFAKQLFTMIQGAVTMATIMGDRKYLLNTMVYLDQLIQREIKSV